MLTVRYVFCIVSLSLSSHAGRKEAALPYCTNTYFFVTPGVGGTRAVIRPLPGHRGGCAGPGSRHRVRCPGSPYLLARGCDAPTHTLVHAMQALSIEKNGNAPEFTFDGPADILALCPEALLHFVFMEVMKNAVTALVVCKPCVTPLQTLVPLLHGPTALSTELQGPRIRPRFRASNPHDGYLREQQGVYGKAPGPYRRGWLRRSYARFLDSGAGDGRGGGNA